MPVGPGAALQKNKNGKFDWQSMFLGETRLIDESLGLIKQKPFSIKAIQYLNELQKMPPFMQDGEFYMIQHALNSGEYVVFNGSIRYTVDGFAEIKGEKFFIEFNGLTNILIINSYLKYIQDAIGIAVAVIHRPNRQKRRKKRKMIPKLSF